jgi:hypothetical protein
MDAAWIQIFVLTMAECVAPAGKTICQEREFDLQFLTRADCEYALEQLVVLKEASASVIVNKSKSSCAPSARQADVFASLEAVSAASGDKSAWRAPKDDESTSTSHVSHQERLADMPSCEESDGVAPCKSGGIIIEAETQEEAVEVWRRDP